jgi:hypothetical protein
MKIQKSYRILFIGVLLILASTLITAPTASGDRPVLVSPTPSPESITIFADKDSLTVYVPGNVAASALLKDFDLEYHTGGVAKRFFQAYMDEFAPYLDGTVSEPSCLHLERAGSDAPFPPICNFAHRPIRKIPDGSVVWWSQVSKSTHTLFVYSGDARLEICDPGFSRCEILIYPPAPPPPTPTHTPTSTSTVTPTSTQTPPKMPTLTPTPTLVRGASIWDVIAQLMGGAQPTETLTPTESSTKLPTKAPSSAPTDTPTPVPIVAPTETPIPAPDYSGRLAIPVSFGFDQKVYVTEINGAGINGPSPISIEGKHPMFGPGGESLIINGKIGDIVGVFLTDGWGQTPELLINTNSACWPVLSPDGSELLYSETSLDCKLHRRKTDSDGLGFEVRVNDRQILAKNPLWTDDNLLVFYSCATWRDQPGDCGIWVTDADTINPKRIVVGNHAWPTDAKHGLMTFMSAEDGDWDVYMMSLDGGQLRNITNNECQDGMAAIAPDGRSIAYISDESGAWALWTVTLNEELEKKKWFEIDPQRGSINVANWHEDRMSWTQ